MSSCIASYSCSRLYLFLARIMNRQAGKRLQSNTCACSCPMQRRSRGTANYCTKKWQAHQTLRYRLLFWKRPRMLSCSCLNMHTLLQQPAWYLSYFQKAAMPLCFCQHSLHLSQGDKYPKAEPAMLIRFWHRAVRHHACSLSFRHLTLLCMALLIPLARNGRQIREPSERSWQQQDSAAKARKLRTELIPRKLFQATNRRRSCGSKWLR